MRRLVLVGILFCLYTFNSTARADDSRVVKVPAGLDRNGNRISDLLEAELGVYTPPIPGLALGVPAFPQALPDTAIDVLIALSGPPDVLDEEEVTRCSGILLGTWRNLVYAVAARLNPAELSELVQDSARIVWVERSPRSRTALVRATEHIRVRSVWTGAVGLPAAYTGYGYQVAVLDTGIDSGHPDFSGKVYAWQDMVNSETNPRDRNGHGTHIAGIITGSGAGAREHGYPISFPSYFPEDLDTGWIELVPVRSTSVRSLTARLMAEEPGTYYFLLEDENNRRLLQEEILGDGNDEVGYVLQDEGLFSVIFAHENSPESFYVGRILAPYESSGDGFSVTAGVAPGSRISVYKILGDDGEGEAVEFLDALDEIARRAGNRSVVAANASLTFDSESNTIDTAVNNLIEEGVVFSVAAGNERAEGVTIGSPGTASLSIAVGAHTLNDELSEYSNPGGSGEPMKPDLLAPGGGGMDLTYIFSADTNDADTAEQLDEPIEFFDDRFLDDYTGKIGTSQAAAFVSGAVALLAEAKGSWRWGDSDDPEWAKMILLMTASEIYEGEIAQHVPTLGRSDQPKDVLEGYGRMNIDAALEAATLSYPVGSEARGDLDSGFGGKRVWARSVNLLSSEEYRFELNNPALADYDLYLYRGSPDDNGEPVISVASSGTGRGDEEISWYRPADDGTYYVVVKRVHGTGQFSLVSRSREASAGEDGGCGCRMLPEDKKPGSPDGVLAGILFLLLPIIIVRMMRVKTSI